MRASIISVGDELLIGQVVNTNASWLGEVLSGMGITPVRVCTVGDTVEEIADEIRHSFRFSDTVVVTGGLGPTHDDVTRDAIADFLQTELKFDEGWFRHIQRRFERRGMTVPERNRSQALVPSGIDVLPNRMGTAPGFWRSWTEDGRHRVLVVLPGVPFEMESLVQDHVAPRLLPLVHSRIRQITLRTAGIGESHLQEILAPVVGELPADTRLAYLPSLYGVRVRVTTTGDLDKPDDGVLDEIVGRIREAAGDYVYGTGDESLEEVVARMLTERGLRIGTAESCTGGAVCDLLTDIPGASAYVAGGVVAYCNSVKVDLLGVDPAAVERDGAVSEEVALQMAFGARRVTGADIGVSSTGILGPTGGTPGKPVGTVWIAYADGQTSGAEMLRFGRDRRKNKQRAAAAVLNMIRRALARPKEAAGHVQS